MKDQTSFSATELREQFETALRKSRETFATDGTDVILRHMSDTVRALQEAGGAIGITVHGGSHTNAYDMMYTAAGKAGSSGSGNIDAYGYFQSGEGVKLFAIGSSLDNTKIARLYLSRLNTREEGGRNAAGGAISHAAIAADCFDFNEDPEALKKLQVKLAEFCAENAVALENDPGRVFNKDPSGGDTLLKTSPRLKGQPPAL